MKVKELHEKVYNARLLLIYDCGAFEAQSYLQKRGIRSDLVKCTGQTGAYTWKPEGRHDFSQQRYYMYIEKTDAQPRTLVHEIGHLVFMALRDCGIKVTDETDEIFCYYYDWWFEHLSPLFMPQIKIKNTI